MFDRYQCLSEEYVVQNIAKHLFRAGYQVSSHIIKYLKYELLFSIQHTSVEIYLLLIWLILWAVGFFSAVWDFTDQARKHQGPLPWVSKFIGLSTSSIPLPLWKYDDVLIKFLRFDSLPLEHFLFSCYFYSRKSKGSPGSGIFRIIYLLYITTTVKINSAIELNKEMVTLVLVSGVAHRSFVRVIYQWLSTTTLNIWLCGHLYFLKFRLILIKQNSL